MSERIPPQSIESEMCTLGAMILDPVQIADVLLILDAECFYRQDHQIIFSCIKEIYLKENAADLVMLRDTLKQKDKLEQIGGVEYLVEIAESAPSAANMLYYAEIVKRTYLQRCIISLCNRYANDAYSHKDQEEVQELIDEMEQAVFKLSGADIKRQVQPISKNLHSVVKSIINHEEAVQGLSTGFREFDELTGGLHPGELMIVAGRPSMGKTAWALNVAEYMAMEQDKGVVLFSMEMSDKEIIKRNIISHSGVSSYQIRNGYISQIDIDDIVRAEVAISPAPIYIDDTPHINPLEILSKGRALKLRHDIQLIVIDYMQLVQSPGRMSPYETITYISRQFKLLARELDISVIAISQLSRGPENREDHRPRLGDLRESGAIEQDADTVVFVYREDYYHKINNGSYEPTNQGEIIVAKQRNGPTGSINLSWNGDLMKFSNLITES